MREIQNRCLWLGHAGDLRDPAAVLSVGISAVVELADSEPPAAFPRDVIHCRFPLSDGGENAQWLLGLAVETVAALLKSKVLTLVCCSAGLSRSVAIAAAAISAVESRPLAECLTLVARRGPADVSPNFWHQIQMMLRDKEKK
ncbi:MAG: dual specificity protein phosphatase family protein [Gemmataceae bacterium]